MEDELPRMIPTFVRDKIPHQLSFVASAKTLSLAWQDVPQFEFLRLWFSCNVPKALRPTTEPQLVLEVSYFRMTSSRFFASGSPSWDVHVGVCHGEEVHDIRHWLRDEGLSKSRSWLEQHAKLHGEFTSARWRATFNEDSRTFEVALWSRNL